MSRIGKMPISIADGVEVKIDGNKVSIKGKLGTLDFSHSDKIKLKLEDKTLEVLEPKNKENIPLWGTTRAILANMVEGVTNGFKKSLEINGVGYKFDLAGNKLVLSIGFSHKVEMIAPEGVKMQIDEKAKNIVHITGIDKQLVGQFASKIRAKKKPEPYKGKGIKYVGEQIRRKVGKTGK